MSCLGLSRVVRPDSCEVKCNRFAKENSSLHSPD